MRPKLSTIRTDTERAADAERQRRHRARQRQGDALYRLELPELAVAEALIASTRMSEDATRRRSLVEQALTEVMLDWVRRWKL